MATAMPEAGRPVAIVTGAGGGIGTAIVRRLLDEGYFVNGWDIAPGRLGEIRDPNFSVSVVDVRNKASVESRRSAIASSRRSN